MISFLLINDRSKEIYWTFFNCLSMNSDFLINMKYYIKSTLETMEKEGITDFKARWLFLQDKALKKEAICFENIFRNALKIWNI